MDQTMMMMLDIPICNRYSYDMHLALVTVTGSLRLVGWRLVSWVIGSNTTPSTILICLECLKDMHLTVRLCGDLCLC